MSDWVLNTETFCKKGVTENFAKFTRNHLCKNLFCNKAADLRLEIFKNTFFTENLEWLLL